MKFKCIISNLSFRFSKYHEYAYFWNGLKIRKVVQTCRFIGQRLCHKALWCTKSKKMYCMLSPVSLDRYANIQSCASKSCYMSYNIWYHSRAWRKQGWVTSPISFSSVFTWNFQGQVWHHLLVTWFRKMRFSVKKWAPVRQYGQNTLQILLFCKFFCNSGNDP